MIFLRDLIRPAAELPEAEVCLVGPPLNFGTSLRAEYNNILRAANPEKDEEWSVSYELFVPREPVLALNAVNGGISLDNLQLAITFETTSGGVDLANLGGNVKGETNNDGIDVSQDRD